MSTSALDAPAAADDAAVFDNACTLIETEFNTRRITTGPTHFFEHLYRIRQHKAALVRAVNQSIHVHYLTEAFRVVDAAYPYLTSDGRCTDAAVTAACDPLYGGLAGYRTSTQRMLRQEARGILTRAIAAADGTEVA
ncbi:hypothetical protein [Amycolatopsis anabasis]|uniref:hypothetical protein n=1 Tax=Amycolatopsis anabasis TaxID=1840409 RepID=UPI00131BAB67|nr:hypothetical protein [Amycolatopsis anabasis]